MNSKRVLSLLMTVVIALSMFVMDVMADSPQVTAVNASYDGRKTTTVSGNAVSGCNKVWIGILDEDGYQVAVDTAYVSDGVFSKAINTGELKNNSIYTVKVCDAAGDTDYTVTTFVAVKSGGGQPTPSPAPTPKPTPEPSSTPSSKPVSPPTPSPASTPVPSGEPVRAEIDSLNLEPSTGKAMAKVTKDALGKAFEASNEVVVDIEEVVGAKGYVTELPAEILASGDSDRRIVIKTGLATIYMQTGMLDHSLIENAKSVQIEISPVDKNTLDETAKELIGDRPVIDLSLKIDGIQTNWHNLEVPVTVSIPYEPSASELADPEHIVIFYIDGSGAVHSVPNGKYDAETGMVTFTTTHFSVYAVSFVKKSFDDLGGFDWARKQIEVLASKGIINGTSAKTFDPKSDIKRADFVILLVKALGLEAKAEDNFSDVPESAYYAPYVAVAKKLGIAAGTGNNMFRPEDKISRQDIMVLIDRALAIANKELTSGNAQDLDNFADKDRIAPYAQGSVATLVKNGIVTGDGKNIKPRENATRAEAAVMLYRVYYR